MVPQLEGLEGGSGSAHKKVASEQGIHGDISGSHIPTRRNRAESPELDSFWNA